MEIPKLAPDLVFTRLPTTPAAIDFVFAVKRAAMVPHVEQRWPWDDAFQRDLLQRRFDERAFFQIRQAGRPIGGLSLMVHPEHVQFGEFYLLPEVQRRGLGTAILRHCLAQADDLGLPVRLEYLHWNPAGALYRREGFAEIGTSDTTASWNARSQAAASPRSYAAGSSIGCCGCASASAAAANSQSRNARTSGRFSAAGGATK
jgi:GNAT superfamily N-acetyltransferase